MRIVEGADAGLTDTPDLIAAYDTTDDWADNADEYGPLTTIDPVTVSAWRSAGWAVCDCFQQSGRWVCRVDGSNSHVNVGAVP